MSWQNYLPSVLQVGDIYWIIAVCVATVAALRTLPENLRPPWLIQLGTLCIAFAFSFLLLGRTGLVYAFGSSIIASSLATSFYDIALRAVETKIRALLGVPPADLQTPRPSTPDSHLP